MMRETLVKRIEHYTTAPALVLSFTMLCALIVPLAVHLPPSIEKIDDRVGWAAWLLFATEYAIRLYAALDRKAFFRENLTDLAVIASVLPIPLVAGNAAAFSFVRACRVFIVAFEIGKDISHLCRARNVPYAIAIVALAIVTCGVLAYHFESTVKGANITDPGDGMWWALTTITTVGYGDRYPVTWHGRFIATVLMFIGIAFTGIISAALVSVFLRKTEDEVEEEDLKFEERVQHAIAVELQPIRAKLDAIAETLKTKGT
jgi:voltage-gated potassium channel